MMTAGKTLDTGNALYGNIVRALSPDLTLSKHVALAGGLDTPEQTTQINLSDTDPTATWTAVQGIARSSTNWFAINTDTLIKYDLSSNLLITNNSPFAGLPAGLDHCGDGIVDGLYLYVALSNYSGGSATQKVIAKYLLSTLALDSYFDLVTHTDLNASGCCISKDGNELLVTSFLPTTGADQRNTDVYRFNKLTGAFIGIHTLSTPSVGIQSITYHASTDSYYIGSHDQPNALNTIYNYDTSFDLITVIDPDGTTFEMEGVASFGDNLYFNHIAGSPRILDFENVIISNNPTKSYAIQFLNSSIMTDDVTILIKIKPLSLFNFNSVVDNQTYVNDWESWIYADGRLAWRVDSSANSIYSGINAGQEYLAAFTWSRSGGSVSTKLGVDGIYEASNTGTWKTPPASGMWLAGINGSNNQGNNLYSDILVFDKVLSDAELLSAYNNFDDFYVTDSVAISLSVTETLNSFADASSIDVSANVGLSVTEVLGSFVDLSSVIVTAAITIEASVTESFQSFTDSSAVTVTEAASIDVSVTEVLNSFIDSSALNVSANIDATITEVLNSFLDGSNVTIAKDISIQVTEVLASFIDNSFVRMPTAWVDKAPTITTYEIKPTEDTDYITKPQSDDIWTDKG